MKIIQDNELFVYIFGVILSYLVAKFLTHKSGGEYTWEDVGFNLFISLFSWVALLIIYPLFLSIGGLVACIDRKKIKLPSKPPKWL